MSDWTAAVRGTVWAEVGYATADGPEAATAVPHMLDGTPVLALTYARRPLAEALERAGEAVLACSDGRFPLRGWCPVAVKGRVRLEADPDGEVFTDALLDDELRKHPPSRRLADSLMQRREHWWYLPRLLVRLTEPVELPRVRGREDPSDAVCFLEGPDGLEASTVSVSDPSGAEAREASPGSTLDVRPQEPGEAPSGRAALVWHDFSIPDFERHAELVLRGRLEGTRFIVEGRRGTAHLPRPPNVWRRLVEHERFQRRCKQGLRAGGGAHPPM